jgi:acyl-CoA dehydrogenase
MGARRRGQGGHVTLRTHAAEENALRDAVRAVCADYPPEYWRGLEPDRYPDAFVKAMTEAGLLAVLIPQEYGGSGLGLEHAAVILEEVNAAGGNASACHAQMYTMGTLLRHGSEDQKQRWLPQLASGEVRLQAFGVTEREAGSETTQIETRAERGGDGWIIDGHKAWTSRALHSDLMLLLARTAPYDDSRRSDGLSVFLVDLRDLDGVTIKPTAAMVNHATS